MSKKLLASMASGLRNSRPWLGADEYGRTMRGPKDSNYYICLGWELTVDSVGDKLRETIGPKFDRNAFVTACGAAKYTCTRCYHEVFTDGSKQCACEKPRQWFVVINKLTGADVDENTATSAQEACETASKALNVPLDVLHAFPTPVWSDGKCA